MERPLCIKCEKKIERTMWIPNSKILHAFITSTAELKLCRKCTWKLYKKIEELRNDFNLL